MKFNFIIPSWSYWQDPIRAQPLTQMYLSTILENDKHRIEITDLRDGPKLIKDSDAYFYTVASPDIKEVEGLVKGLKKSSQGKHIAGGPHVNIFPEESMKIFDAICLGNGEESIKRIADDLPFPSKVYATPIGSDYPYPKRHFLSKEKIITSLFKTCDIPSTTVLFSHGCPFGCSFCANYNRQAIKRRSLDNISSEIDYLKNEYHIEGLSLQDEICIPPKLDDALSFLDLMKQKKIVWRGQSRAGVPGNILNHASKSGCLELSFGLESVDQEVLDKANKAMKVELVRETMKECKNYRIKTRLYLLNGLPGEPEDIVEKTKRFIDEINPDVVLLSTLQPYPGSPIYNNPERFGIEWIDKDFSKYNHLRCRFKDAKDNIDDVVPFRYAEGKGFKKERILENLLNLQEFLRERGLNK